MTAAPIRRAEQGATAGLLATLPMTAVMLAAERLGLMGRQPPAKITDAALDAAHVDAGPDARRLWTAISHFGFGAAAGALFSLLRGGRPSPARAAIDGAVYGTAVWAVSYAGWVPELGIMRRPTEDRPGRPLSMIVAHWVFGAALGALVARRRGGP